MDIAQLQLAFLNELPSTQLNDLAVFRFPRTEIWLRKGQLEERFEPIPENCFSYLKKHGRGSLAFSSLQDGIDCFLANAIGYVPYSKISDSTPVCLSDPICAEAEKESLILQFIRQCRKAPIFLHINKHTAEILQKQGFYITEFGTETIIDVQTFSTTGSKKEFLRSQRNRAEKDGVKVVELNSSQISKNELLRISKEWLEGKAVNSNELAFLTRPVVFEDEPGVRKFYAMKDKKILGFVYFDPMYEDGRIVGYLANNLRTNASVSYSVCDFIILEALKKFRQEGIKELSLGFSPFSNLTGNGDFKCSKPLQELFRFTFEHCNYLYSFKQLAFHKQRYRPELPGARQVKVYCATKSAFPVISIYGIFLKMGFKPLPQTIKHLVSVTHEIFGSKLDSILKFGAENIKTNRLLKMATPRSDANALQERAA